MSNTMKWWHIYGPFDEGEENLPRMGQVIAHYGKMQGLKTVEMAQRLSELGWEIGTRRMEQLLKNTNANEPDQFSRRRLLARAFAIPPILIGLAAMGTEDYSVSQHSETFINVDPGLLSRYQSTLSSYWDAFYSSAITKHIPSLMQWHSHLKELADHESQYKHEVYILLCRFDQLIGVAARDKRDIPTAKFYFDEAVELADQLENAELRAASLFRRAKLFTQIKNVDAAIQDLKTAIPHANRSRPNLRGYIYQMTATTISLLPPTKETAYQFHRYIEEAGKILRNGGIEQDDSFVRLTPAGYHQDRARGYLKLGDIESALEAITMAEKMHQPNMVRWHEVLTLLRAEAYAQSGEIEWACHQAEEAFKLTEATQSALQRRELQTFHSKLERTHPHRPEVKRLGALVRG